MRNRKPARKPQPPPPASSPWGEPAYRYPSTGGGGLSGGTTGLPWWASPPAGMGGAGQPQAPPPLAVGESGEYGPGTGRPDAGFDPTWGAGGNPYGTSQQPGSTEVGADTMGRLLSLFGVPSSAAGRGLQWYDDRYGDNDPYDTANPGNTGPVYYGPTRYMGLGREAEFGDQFANDFANESANMWGVMNPGLWGGFLGGPGGGFSGSGSGGPGGVGSGGPGDPFAGTANPWHWGGPALR